jgi:CO dehydrogenase maturation factor
MDSKGIGLKIAISGKGGVGKSTLAAAFALLLAKRGAHVLACDADPDANLASALGLTEQQQKEIIPISRRAALIEERTGAKVKQYGQMFKLNHHVADIAETCGYQHKGISLVVLGAVEQGGSGCACPENVLIRALVSDLVLNRDEVLIMDMEAGVEHLGRATVSGVDVMIVVVEPGQRSVESTRRIIALANDIGLDNIVLVVNKVATPADEEFVRAAFPDNKFIGFIPYAQELRTSDRYGKSVLDGITKQLSNCFVNILENTISSLNKNL